MGKKYILFFLVFLLSINTIYADQINNSIFNITSINTTITINNSWYYVNILVPNGSLYIENLTYSNSAQSTNRSPMSFNFTENNRRYSGLDFPYVSDSSADTKIIITSNLIQPLNISTRFNSTHCNLTISYASGQGNFNTINNSACGSPNSTVIVNNIQTERGDNIITLSGPPSGGGGGGGGGDPDQNPPSDRQDTGRGASPCDVVADSYNSCYYLDPQGTGLCLSGCQDGYICNSDYRCTFTDTIDEQTQPKRRNRNILRFFMVFFFVAIYIANRRGNKREESVKDEINEPEQEQQGDV